MLKKIKLITLIFALLSISACMMPTMPLKSLKEVKNDEVIIVGKLQLSPRITKEEVVFSNVIVLGSSKDELHKTLYIKASEKFYDLKGSAGFDMTDTVVTQDGEYFYFPWKKNKPLHILGTSFFTHWSSSNRESMTYTIKKGLRVKHTGMGKAVYVGTITFKRDEFWNIKKIDISQKGFNKAQKAFSKKFNTRIKLKKAKLYSSRK